MPRLNATAPPHLALPRTRIASLVAEPQDLRTIELGHTVITGFPTLPSLALCVLAVPSLLAEPKWRIPIETLHSQALRGHLIGDSPAFRRPGPYRPPIVGGSTGDADETDSLSYPLET